MADRHRALRTWRGLRIGGIVGVAGALVLLALRASACRDQPARHDFPYASRYVEVLGSRMHYVEVGSGDPIVLIHGQPTWSYLWRKVMPHLESSGRVIAVDLIGFGKSERPDIAYTVEDHVAYFAAFLEALELTKMTFVGHDWGSFLAFQYAARHPGAVKAVVFMEAILPPDFFRPDPDAPHYERALAFFDAARIVSDSSNPEGRRLIEHDNDWIERVLPLNVLRTLTEDELDAYREPFADPGDRFPMLQFPRQLRSRYGFAEITAYSTWLAESPVPKLMFTVTPGVTAPTGQVDWVRAHVRGVTIQHLGEGLHYLQEDYPDAIGRGIAEWLRGGGQARVQAGSEDLRD